MAGLQGMALPNALGNLEILSNPRLTDIDALSTVFACREDGTTQVDPPAAPVGVVEVTSEQSRTVPARCLLTTAEQVRDRAQPSCDAPRLSRLEAANGWASCFKDNVHITLLAHTGVSTVLTD